MPRQYTRIPLAERFWAKVDRSGGPDACWPWMGATVPKGYGRIVGEDGKLRVASRVAWELTRGPISDGMEVCHDCPGGDNPNCCNPAHFFLGTRAENLADASRKGRLVGNRGIFKGERNCNVRLSAADVRAIRGRYAQGARQTDLADQFEVGQNQISRIVRRQLWRHLD